MGRAEEPLFQARPVTDVENPRHGRGNTPGAGAPQQIRAPPASRPRPRPTLRYSVAATGRAGNKPAPLAYGRRANVVRRPTVAMPPPIVTMNAAMLVVLLGAFVWVQAGGRGAATPPALQMPHWIAT